MDSVDVSLPPNMQSAHLTTRVKIKRTTRRKIQRCWLSQANSIGEEYGAVDSYWIPNGVKFRISVWYPEDNYTLRGTFMADTPSSEIYLFLFPPEVKYVDGFPVISIPSPRDAFYWSFHPRGTTRMTAEEAEEVGVPYVFFESWITGASWAPGNYETLADFHRAKGFDPSSRQIAIELGYPVIGPPVAFNTSLSEIDETEVEYARRQMRTYPKQDLQRAAVRCPTW
ncbi:hypothetical protein C8R46DRAFT_184866 [Mycena filopes]|nr:hypothetical protein C8R46DRAFT_184866 [Mycena filopes]